MQIVAGKMLYDGAQVKDKIMTFWLSKQKMFILAKINCYSLIVQIVPLRCLSMLCPEIRRYKQCGEEVKIN